MTVSGTLSGHSKSCNAVTTLNKSAQHVGEQGKKLKGGR
jgi:hypothetical protein